MPSATATQLSDAGEQEQIATGGAPDKLEIELFRHACSSVLDEIEVNITQTAYSPLIYEYKDYVVGLLDADFVLISQSRLSLPGFLSDLGPIVSDAISVAGVETLAPGDVLISNYAAVQGHHLNNVVTITPIFQDGAVVAYVAIRGHWADVGGLEPGSMSWHGRDIWQEGVQYRGMRIMRAGELVPENIATCMANTRMEEYVRGDMMSQLGGCLLGASRWEERVAARWSRERVGVLVAAQIEQSAALARARVANLPRGVFSASATMDNSGAEGTPPLNFTVSIEVNDDGIVIDLTDVPDQVEGPINSGAGVSDARVAYKSLIVPDHPTDDGLFAPLEVRTRPGSIVTASKGAALAHWNNCKATLVDLIVNAFGQIDAELAPAGHHGSQGAFVFSGRRPDGSWWQSIDSLGGGWGGHARADGFSPLKTLNHGDNRSLSIEVLEGRFPFTIDHMFYRPDSAGRGKHRGGLGIERMITVNEPAFVTTSMDRTVMPPWGAAGGESGQPGAMEVCLPGTSEWVTHNKSSQVPLPAGSKVRLRSAGGGGWGRPEERDPEAQAADLRDGYVTQGAAAQSGS